MANNWWENSSFAWWIFCHLFKLAETKETAAKQLNFLKKMVFRGRNAIYFWNNSFSIRFRFFPMLKVSNFWKKPLIREKTLNLGDSTISYAFCSNFATFNVFPTEKIFQMKTNFSMVFEKSYYVNGNQPQTLGRVLVTFNSWFKTVNN